MKPKKIKKPVEPKKILPKNKEIYMDDYESLGNFLNRVIEEFGSDVDLNNLNMESDAYEDYHDWQCTVKFIYSVGYNNPRYKQEMEEYNEKLVKYNERLKQYESDLAIYETSDEYKDKQIEVEKRKKKQKDAKIKKLKKQLAELGDEN